MHKKWMMMAIALYLSFFELSPHMFSQCGDSQCGEMKKHFSHQHLGEPTIWGDPYLVPEIRLKVTERSTSKPIGAAKIYMHYLWKHFRLPYYEIQDGIWDKAHDVITCMTNESGIVQFPKYSVVPRGWYNGDRLRNRLPEFLEIEVKYKNNAYRITKNQLKKIHKKSIKRPIELKRPYKFKPEIKMELIP